MKRTSRLIVMVFGILLLTRIAPVSLLHASRAATTRTVHSKTSVVPAEDSGDDGDDSGSDDAD